MKAQKDELQRQRDALQRQIDLFEEHRRQRLTSSDHRTSPPSTRPAPSTEPATDDRDRVSRVRNDECGSQPPVRHLSPLGLGRANVADSRMLARVGSTGNMAALEGRTVTRGGSVGNLTSRRDVKPFPAQQMSTSNVSRLSSGVLNPLRAATSLPSPTSVQQLIPTKLSNPSNNPSKAARDHRCVEKSASRAVSVEKDASPAAGYVATREPSRAGSMPANILPLKLAEGQGHPSRSSTSSSAQCVSPRSLPTDNDDDDDDDDEDDGRYKEDDHAETEILYF